MVTRTVPPTLVEDLSTPEVSEEKIDTVLQLLHEADPTQPESDAPELPGQVRLNYFLDPAMFCLILGFLTRYSICKGKNVHL